MDLFGHSLLAVQFLAAVEVPFADRPVLAPGRQIVAIGGERDFLDTDVLEKRGIGCVGEVGRPADEMHQSDIVLVKHGVARLPAAIFLAEADDAVDREGASVA